jgi:hypothetical protein
MRPLGRTFVSGRPRHRERFSFADLLSLSLSLSPSLSLSVSVSLSLSVSLSVSVSVSLSLCLSLSLSLSLIPQESYFLRQGSDENYSSPMLSRASSGSVHVRVLLFYSLSPSRPTCPLFAHASFILSNNQAAAPLSPLLQSQGPGHFASNMQTSPLWMGGAPASPSVRQRETKRDGERLRG